MFQITLGMHRTSYQNDVCSPKTASQNPSSSFWLLSMDSIFLACRLDLKVTFRMIHLSNVKMGSYTVCFAVFILLVWTSLGDTILNFLIAYLAWVTISHLSIKWVLFYFNQECILNFEFELKLEHFFSKLTKTWFKFN